MPSAITAVLDEALAALAKQRADQALDALVRAWATIRAAPLADVIEQLSDQLASDRPLLGATQTELEQQWRERAEDADAVELGALLPSLIDTDSHQARRRLKLIASRAPDPRIASALTAIVERPPFTSSSTAKFWATLHEQLLASADPRALRRLEQVAEPADDASSNSLRLDSWRRRGVERMRAVLAEIPTTLADDDLARVATMAERIAAASARARDAGPELLAAVLADPEALELRQVYADYLLSVGDPRGEFIALQLAEGRGELGRAGKARASALVREYGHAWAGPLARVLVRGHSEFRNGFPSVARIRRNSRGIEDLIHDPSWATVEQLEHAPPKLVSSPAMRSLRSLRWTAREIVAAAHDEQLTFPTIVRLYVENNSWQSGWVGLAGGLELLRMPLEGPERFPALRELVIELGAVVVPEQLAWLWAGELGDRLESLTLTFGDDSSVGLSRYLRSVRNARLPTSGLSRFELSNRLFECRFEHGSAPWSRVTLAAGPRPRVPELATEIEFLREVEGTTEFEFDSAVQQLLAE